jgi:hypothetical protein
MNRIIRVFARSKTQWPDFASAINPTTMDGSVGGATGREREAHAKFAIGIWQKRQPWTGLRVKRHAQKPECPVISSQSPRRPIRHTSDPSKHRRRFIQS